MMMEQTKRYQRGHAGRWIYGPAGAVLLAGTLAACGVTSTSGTVGTLSGPLATSTATAATAANASGTATSNAVGQHPPSGCPAVLVDYAGGPLLYWAPPTTVTGPAGKLPTDLCAIGFQPGEQITLTYVPTDHPSGPAHPAGTTTANPYGSFTLPYLDVVPPCIPAATTSTLQARGDHGSQASLHQPVAPQMSCQPSGPPR